MWAHLYQVCHFQALRMHVDGVIVLVGTKLDPQAGFCPDEQSQVEAA